MPIDITGKFTPSGGAGAFPLYDIEDVDGTATAGQVPQTDGTVGGVTWVTLDSADISDGTPNTRTITINGTTNEIDSSAGAQDLSANRTWTIGLADNLQMPGSTGFIPPVKGTTGDPTAAAGLVYYNSTDQKLRGCEDGATWADLIGGGGGGEANTASNQGTDGVGVFDTKSGVDLQFRHVAPGSTKITTTLNVKDIDIDVVEGNIDHDALLNFVANEHVDHSSVTMAVLGTTNETTSSAGVLDITSSRSWTIGIADDAVMPGTGAMVVPDGTTAQEPSATGGKIRYDTDLDLFRIADGGTPAWRSLTHDGLSEFVANEHIDHSAVTVTLTEGDCIDISGAAQDLTSNLTFTIDSDFSEADLDNAMGSTEHLIYTDAAGPAGNKKIVFSSFEGLLNHDNLSGFVGNEHIDHTSVTMTVAGTSNEIDSSAGAQDISASRTWTIGIADAPTIPGDYMTMPTKADPDPAGSAGRFYYNSTSNVLRWHNGTSWADVGSGGGGDGYKTINCDGATSVTAVSAEETLSLAGGQGITTTGTDGSPDDITIAITNDSITNAMVNSGAEIDYSKLAALATDRIMATNTTTGFPEASTITWDGTTLELPALAHLTVNEGGNSDDTMIVGAKTGTDNTLKTVAKWIGSVSGAIGAATDHGVRHLMTLETATDTTNEDAGAWSVAWDVATAGASAKSRHEWFIRDGSGTSLVETMTLDSTSGLTLVDGLTVSSLSANAFVTTGAGGAFSTTPSPLEDGVGGTGASLGVDTDHIIYGASSGAMGSQKIGTFSALAAGDVIPTDKLLIEDGGVLKHIEIQNLPGSVTGRCKLLSCKPEDETGTVVAGATMETSAGRLVDSHIFVDGAISGDEVVWLVFVGPHNTVTPSGDFTLQTIVTSATGGVTEDYYFDVEWVVSDDIDATLSHSTTGNAIEITTADNIYENGVALTGTEPAGTGQYVIMKVTLKGGHASWTGTNDSFWWFELVWIVP